MYTLRFIRSYTTLLLPQRLVQALIFPLLDYCDTILNDATYKLRARLQKLKNSLSGTFLE